MSKQSDQTPKDIHAAAELSESDLEAVAGGSFLSELGITAHKTTGNTVGSPCAAKPQTQESFAPIGPTATAGTSIGTGSIESVMF